MITLKELNEAYDKLDNFKGAKERVASIHGITGQHLRHLLSKGDMEESRMLQIMQAIKQSASEHVKKINEINVEIQTPI